MNTSSIAQEILNFCHALRNGGVGYGDYHEQLTNFLFLKLVHEYAQELCKRAEQTASQKSCWRKAKEGV